MGKKRNRNRNRPAPPQNQQVVVERWKNYFGAGDLEDWQRLCGDLGLDGGLPSNTQCREVRRVGAFQVLASPIFPVF